MQVPSFMRYAMICVATAVPATGFTQNISAPQKTRAVQTIAKHVASNYVNVELGGQIASQIQAANHRGEFSAARNWTEFDDAVTKLMQQISNDPHLYVRYDEQEARSLSLARTNANTMNSGSSRLSADESGITETAVLDGNVGYIKLTDINVTKESLPGIEKSIEALKNTDAMIIDLRDNGGGGSELGAVYESFFLPPQTLLLHFTDRNGQVKSLATLNRPQLMRYKNPVYIIINRKTASAAEALAFVLQQQKRAIIVGQTSAGAAYMNERFPVEEHSYVSVSTSVPHLPGSDKSWAGIGVRPDIKVKNGDPLEVAKASVYKRLRK